jgi:shikimate dehydrogenase
MMRAGVVGDPIAHSLSPLIHGAWIAALGLDAAYERFHITEADFAGFVGREAAALKGVNVTIPHKEAALALADTASDLARACGAANVLLFRGGKVEARNTDGEGLLGAFRQQAPAWSPDAGPVVILGAGGAARGAAAALLDAGVPELRIVNRTLGRARQIEADLQDLAKERSVVATAWENIGDAMAGASALVNATSLGLAGGQPLEIDLSSLSPSAVVMDMVYKPLKTPLLAQAEARGLKTVDGLEMLIRQAAPSFEAFYGAAPPEAVDVRSQCLKALG